MKKKGYVQRNSGGKARDLKILVGKQDTGAIPIIGKIAAGSPVLSYENSDGYLSFRNIVRHPEKTFALQVHGDSMVEAGIHHGDFVLVQQQFTAKNNDIVVAMIDGETTIKRFSRTDTELLLIPENKTMNPLRFNR